MNSNLTNMGVVLAIVIAIGAYFFPISSVTLGANGTGPAHYQMENFLQGVQAGVRNQFSVSNTGALDTDSSVTLDGGAATSTIILQSTAKGGCLQMPNSAGVARHAYINGVTWVIATGSC